MESLRSDTRASISTVAIFMRQVYAWMCAGLAMTALVAWYVASTPAVMQILFSSMVGPIVLMLATLGLVWYLNASMDKLSSGMATGLFLLYSALMGAMLSSVLLIYTQTAITSAFVTSAGTFAAMSAYGAVTKRDLSAMGTFMFMGLVGLIIASLVNLFLQSSMMTFVISVLGVIIFAGLTAYDTQRLREMGASAPVDDALAMRRGSILGALTLYLDFINIFLFMLRLFGGNRE